MSVNEKISKHNIYCHHSIIPCKEIYVGDAKAAHLNKSVKKIVCQK